MSATLPDLLAGRNPDAASLAMLLRAITRVTNIGYLNLNGTASLSTASSSYVDIAGGSLTWRKQGGTADSDVLIIGSYSGFGGAINLLCVGAVGFTGPLTYDHYWGSMYNNTASTHAMLMGCRIITSTTPGALPAGTYTVKPRAKVLTAGTLTIDANDTVNFVVAELPK